MRWPRGVRARLAGALVLLVAATSVVLGVGATAFVDARLHQQALSDAAAQATFDLTVTVPGRQLPDEPTVDDVIRSGLTDTFRRRNVESLIDLGAGETVKSSDTLSDLLQRLPADVPARVGRGELAYAWIDVGGAPSLVVGGLAPGGDLAVYFVRDVAEISQAVGQLRIVMLAGAAVLILVALVTARTLARGILAPIEEAGRTAERIERGDLLARVPVTSHDEFGTWADRFNRMTDTLAESIRRLEFAQHQNRRFVADVSHELRTPVTALVAEASILREHLGADAARHAADRGAARQRHRSSARLSSRSSWSCRASTPTPRRSALEKVDLGKLIETVRAARSPQATFQAAREAGRHRRRPPPARADPRQLPRQRPRARRRQGRRDRAGRGAPG